MLSNLAGWSIVGGIAFALVFGLVWFSVSMSKKKIRAGWLWVVLVWLYGFVVYDIGQFTGHYISLFTNAPLAILSAFKIFLFDSDISQIRQPFFDSWFFSLNFALVHFLAAIISTLFIIRIIGFSLKERARIWGLSRRAGRRKVRETYLFWGFNDATARLIKSIQEEGRPDRRIIILRPGEGEKEDAEEKSSLAGLIDYISIPKAELEQIESLDCLTVSTIDNLRNVKNGAGKIDVFGGILRLKSLKRLISAGTGEKIHVLFLSEDEKDNLHNLSVMVQDETLDSFVSSPRKGPKRKVCFYCHARYNSIHRVVEDRNLSDTVTVRVVDSSHLSVEMLKNNVELLPVSYVDVEADATVSSAFHGLVIGFSEVGQDAVRFLYEFGAFVKTGSTDDQAVRSDFHLDVVDREMGALAGSFITNSPAIEVSMPFMGNEEKSSSPITLHETDCRGVEFNRKLKEWVRTLNYVVIATDSDELNITMAVRIFEAAVRYRENLDKFCILVRIREDEDSHIRNVALHYNRLWAAYKAWDREKGGHRQMTVRKDAEIDFPIHMFGLDREVYTFRNIIENAAETKAREYKARYEQTVSNSGKSAEEIWDKDIIDVMHLGEDHRAYSPTYAGIMYLRRSQAQDFANCHHEDTKRELIRRALEKSGLTGCSFRRVRRAPKTTTYLWPEAEEANHELARLLIVIAQTEHLRWQASHEILGYVLGAEKDEVRLVHNCLKDWDCLAEEVRSYDCNVSDFIFGIGSEAEN